MPFVARQRERDQLWAGVHEAIEGETDPVVCSCRRRRQMRLLGWLKHRVVETAQVRSFGAPQPSEARAPQRALILRRLR